MINPEGGMPAKVEEKVRDMTKAILSEPVPMILFCPMCHARHIDPPGIAAHHTHACQYCGFLWKPSLVRTVGVRYLPGCGPEDK